MVGSLASAARQAAKIAELLVRSGYRCGMDADYWGAFDTKQEVGFSHSVIPQLELLGVTVRQVRHVVAAGELHVDLVLPNHDRALRNQVLSILAAFEEAYAFTVSVLPALLYADDLADA
jgi:hypothetical protein